MRGMAKKKRDDVTDCATRLSIGNQHLQCGVTCVLCLTAVSTQYRKYFCIFGAIGECDRLLVVKNCCARSD